MKRIIIFFTLLICFIKASAQLPSEPASVLTPNAASLGLYGDIPVSLFTGIPDISIPLYDVKVKDFTLPISLSYHASGVRPDQRAGWTGLGWTLNAGGMIARSVNDIPDEFNNPTYNDGRNAGYYYTHNVLNTSSWNQRSYLRSVAQSNDLHVKDTGPDEFSFHFAGYSGKFYLDHNRNWQVQCDKPVKVQFNGNFLPVPFDTKGTWMASYGYSPCFSGFNITTEDGVRYEFGGIIDAIDFSIDFFNQINANWNATGWYLTKIVLPSGYEIKLTYDRKEFNNQMYIAVRHDLGSSTESSGGVFNLDPECSSSNYYSLVEYGHSGKLLSPVYLTGITTHDAVVSFRKSISNELRYTQSVYETLYMHYNYWYNTDPLPLINVDRKGYPQCLDNLKWYKLDEIVVEDKARTRLVKKIDLNYNDSPSERLALNSITEADGKTYRLYYNKIGSLPGYLSNKTDHWGFFNNTYASLIHSTYYASRNPNPAYATYGILTKIVYPTGGYTEFEFEPHSYRKQLSLNRWESCDLLAANQTAGGVRIKRIKNSDTPQGPAKVTKEYFYVTDYAQHRANASVSSGVLGGQVKYSFDYIVYAFNNNDVKRKISVFSSVSVLPSCHNARGSHVGYTEVIEKRADNSFTRYQFTNFDNGYMDEPADAIIQFSRTPYEPYASKAKDRGLLILREDYNATGNKIKSKSIAYEKDATVNNYVRAMNAEYYNVCPGGATSYDEGTAYKIYTYLLRPRLETETSYNTANDDALTTVIQYAYNGYKLLSKVSTTNSKGETLSEETRYAGDLPSGVYTGMRTKHMIGFPVERISVAGDVVTRSELLTYKRNSANDDYVPDKVYKGQFNSPVPYSLFVRYNGLSMDSRYGLPEVEYAGYDYRSNVTELIDKNSRATACFWDTSGSYLNAVFTNARNRNETFYESFEESGNSSNGFHSDKGRLGAYTVNLAVSPGREYTIDYQVYVNAKWEYRRYDFDNGTHTINEGGNPIDDVRVYPTDSGVTSYTYIPLTGLRSQTDGTGVTESYEYDTAGRLKEVYIHEGGTRKLLETYEYNYINK